MELVFGAADWVDLRVGDGGHPHRLQDALPWVEERLLHAAPRGLQGIRAHQPVGPPAAGKGPEPWGSNLAAEKINRFYIWSASAYPSNFFIQSWVAARLALPEEAVGVP